MIHIRQKGSSLNSNEAYTVVKVDDWSGELSEHPSIKNHPDLFEIVDCDIPEHSQYLIFIEETDTKITIN